MKLDRNCAAVCGLFCGSCPAYMDNSCGGCLSDNCCCDCFNGFKDCVLAHGAVRCYECVDFPCDKLKEFSTKHFVNGIGHHEKVIEDLSAMKQGGLDSWLEQKNIEYTCKQCGKALAWFDVKTHKC